MLRVPQADLASRPCCMIGCEQRATWWVGPEDTNGLDDYTELCADHVEEMKAATDLAVRL